MNYEKIAEDIISLVSNDYSGCKELPQQEAKSDYLEKVSSITSDKDFYYATMDFLKSYKDAHLTLIEPTMDIPKITFLTRRFNDKLYVSELFSESCPLVIGQEIIKIDNQAISEIAKDNEAILDSVPERQNFTYLLGKSNQLTLSNGDVIETPKEQDICPKKSVYSFELLDEKTGYMVLSDFYAEQPISALIHDNKHLLDRIDSLIIDVRINNGGSDMSYFPLLSYLFKQTFKLDDLNKPNELMYYNVTQRNYDLRQKAFQPFLESEELDDVSRQFIQSELDFFKHHIEKNQTGFIPFTDSPVLDYTVHGTSSPSSIIVLTDVYCGSSGDSFVNLVKESNKVTTLGRNTLGILDYANCCFQEYPLFTLMYPTSKTSLVDEGLGMLSKGVAPDIYVPWTPEHLTEDVDLQYALELLKTKQ
ncbi:S41 family peptidase [Vagococcus sp. JNUCC 83]